MDRLLQRWRIRVAVPFVREGDRLLDIGCFDMTLIERVNGRMHSAVGVDPLANPYRSPDGRVEIMRGTVPGDLALPAGQFDCITMLAVFEHIPGRDALAAECFRLLRPGGRVVMTVPHRNVDHVLRVLLMLRLIHGMSLEQHDNFDVNQTPHIFARAGFTLHKQRTFQLGLNNLFVFDKPRNGEPVRAATSS